MARCTAPINGHRTANGRANCPVYKYLCLKCCIKLCSQVICFDWLAGLHRVGKLILGGNISKYYRKEKKL